MILPFIFTTLQREPITVDRASIRDCYGISEVKRSVVLDSYEPYIDVQGILAGEDAQKYHWILEDPFNRQLAFNVARDDQKNILGFVFAMPKIEDHDAWRLARAHNDLKRLETLLNEADHSIIWIDQLFILQPWRGKGIGKKLLFSVLEQFPQAQKMQLYVGEFNANAVQFYERVGFKKIAMTVAKDLQGNEMKDLQSNPLTHFFMELDLKKLR